MTRVLVAVLLCIHNTYARVTSDKAEVLVHTDLSQNKASFDCPSACRVYTPTSKSLKIIDDKGAEVITFDALHNRAVDKPLELKAGKYFVVNGAPDTSPDFTLYVVQKGAENYDTKVYTSVQEKVDVTNERFVTVLTDFAGFRVSNIDGDLGDVKVYATGSDSVGKCRPVFASRSADNAKSTSFAVFGPIGTIDFGTDKGHHYFTLGYDYLSRPTTELGSSTVLVSPGFIGCPDNQVFTNIYINEVKQAPYTITNEKGVTLQLSAEYSLTDGSPIVRITVNNEDVKLSGTDTMLRDFDGNSLKVSVNWSRAAGDYYSHFSIQLDNFVHGFLPLLTTTLKPDLGSTTSSAMFFVIPSYLFILMCVVI